MGCPVSCGYTTNTIARRIATRQVVNYTPHKGVQPMPKNRTDNRRDWEKSNIKSYTLRLNVKTNPDFASWMESHKPYQNYLKGLIRKDMESSNQQ